jgi:hypothetical protein
MMGPWFEIDERNRTPEQARAAWEAYYATFLGNPRGQQVLADMRRRAAEPIQGAAFDASLAVAKLWLSAFMADTLTLAGAGGDIETIKAIAPLAAGNDPAKETL